MKKSLIIALVFISFSSFASQLSCQVNQYGIGVKETIEINLNQHFYNESGVKSIIISNIEGHEYTIQTSIASPSEFTVSVQDMNKRAIEVTTTAPAFEPTLIHTNNKVSISCIN